MRTIIILLISVLFCTGLVFSQEKIIINEEPFVPKNPEVMGQGASFTGAAKGFNALFYNPAGFAIKGGSFTLASSNAWVYVNPARVAGLLELSDAEMNSQAIGVLNEQITSGGIGLGAAAGMAVVGKGFGLGIVSMVDSYLYGKNLLGVAGDITATAGLIAGYAIPFKILGMTINVGADIRPMFRIHTPLSNKVALGLVQSVIGGGSEGETVDVFSIINSVNALHGMGVGLDAGVIVELGALKIGLSARDIGGTEFTYKQSPMGDVIDGLSGNRDFPEGTEVPGDVAYVIPMNISAGVAFHPDLGGFRYVFDPIIHADLQDPLAVLNEGKSPWTLIHIGGEAKILSIFRVRGGFNQGYLTAGAGIKLLFIDVNASVFTRELGKHIGDKPNSGISLEAAIRF